MRLRKRKLKRCEILNLAESDSDVNVSSEPEMTLNSYFGTDENDNNVENPRKFDLLVFPSPQFREEMLTYNEIRDAKRVCQLLRPCPNNFRFSLGRLYSNGLGFVINYSRK